MNENDPVDADDEEQTDKGLLAGGAAAAGGAAGLAKGVFGKAKDAAAGAKDAATGAASGVTGAAGDAVSGAKDAASGAASGVTGAAGGAASGVAGAAAGAKDAASGAASGVTGAASGAASGVTGAAGNAVSGAKDAATGAASGVTGAAAGVTGGVVAGGAAARAGGTGSTDDVRAGVTGGVQDSAAAGTASAAVAGGATTQMSGGGSGGAGGSGGGFGGGDDDDDEKLIAAAPVSGTNQIVILGLIVAAFMLFGGLLWSFLGFGDDDVVATEAVALDEAADLEDLEETNPACAAVFTALEEDEGIEEEDYEDIVCSSDGDDVTLSGEAATDAAKAAVGTIAAGALLDEEAVFDDEEVTVPEVEEVEEIEEVEEAAAPAVTTEAPVEETTTTTEAPAEETTTTTEAAVEEPFTMWDALNESGEATQFAVIGSALGLQMDLEALEDADGNPIMRTLFAPSDAALQALGPDAIAGLTADPNAAAAVVGYHFLEDPLLAADLIAMDGDAVSTRTGLPLQIDVVDGAVTLNGVSMVVSADFEADNGVVHIIDTVLDPPTINQVLDLDNIEFDPAQSTITAAGQATLGRAVDFFTEMPDVNAVIEGHTDSDGSDGLNDELSQARADAVRQFLIDNGLDGDRFTATGFGENQLILVDGVEDKEASRRIEFVVQ